MGKKNDEMIPKIIKKKDFNPPIFSIALKNVNVDISYTCIWLARTENVSFI